MLEVRGLQVYYGRAHILADVSFAVAPGEVLALLGRNGAGKSTTLKCIIGLVPPAAGEVRYRGERVSGLEPFAIAQRGLGYVPEDRRIFTDLSVRENLEVARQPARPGTPSWSIGALSRLFPVLGEAAERPAAQLSGGEQQMLAIARTLMGNPSCILLDEPSEGLAPIVVDQMTAAVQDLKRQGVAVLLAEQNLHFAAEVADRACILEKGRIHFCGSFAELSANETVRRAYLAV